MKTFLFNILQRVSLKFKMSSFIERLGWFLIRVGRFDVVNDMSKNGEFRIQEIIAANCADNSIVVDCGANIGGWSANLDKLITNKHPDKNILMACIEPSKSTFKELQKRFKKKSKGAIIFSNIAFSNENSQKNLTIVHELAGSNNIGGVYRKNEAQGVEVVDARTFSSWVLENDITDVDFLKIDAEGHDLFVLFGARNLIDQEKIAVIQFEYNWFWLENGLLLKGVFDLLAGSNYSIAKITPNGLVFYDDYHYKMENFIESNYLIMNQKWELVFKQNFSLGVGL